MLRLCSGEPSVYHYHRNINTSTDFSCDIAVCIVDVGTICWRKSNMVNIIIFSLISHNE